MEDSGAFANVQLMMLEPGQGFGQALLIPASIALRTEERFPLIIIHAVNGEALLAEKNRHFRAN